MRRNYDIFIAYHLGLRGITDDKSSYSKAYEIKLFLENQGFKCFLRNPNDSTESYAYTREIACCCKTFLLVVNEYIMDKCESKEQGNGIIIKTIPHDCFIYDEIQGFLNQFEGKTTGPAKGMIQCYCSDSNLSDYDINNLHVSLSQMVPLRDLNSLIFWANKQIKGIIYERKEWGKEIANVWNNIFPPSRPSISELECYKRYFKIIKSHANGNTVNILILGSTVELRELAYNESFNVYVVDYNKDYYDTVSKCLLDEMINREKLIVCNWAEMLEHEELKKSYFDIIIGDLAIGNIKPENIDVTFNAIFELLRQDGYFFGKNLYSFSKDSINENVIRKMFKDFKENYDDGKLETAYAFTMYNLSIYATQERENRKIDFEKIYNKVDELCRELNMLDSSIYKMYCGEATSFKNKMQISFYTYPLLDIITKLNRKLYLVDTEYGKDIYSGKFPLLIYKKTQIRNNFIINRHNCFFKIKNFVLKLSGFQYLKEWSRCISSQYFLVKLSEFFPNMQQNDWKFIFNNIKEQILDTVKVGISDDLVCFIESYSDKKIENETVNLKNVEKLNCFQNKLLSDTYILAILVYLTSTLTDDYHNSNSLYTLVANKLFSLPSKGNLWEPEEAPWIRAKICLCVKNIYFDLNPEYKKIINDTIEWIITFYDDKMYDWKCDVGSHVDTRALCCEVLISYYDKINDNIIKANIINVLTSILHGYVLNGRIFETVVLYPVGNGVINSILKNEKLRNKSYVKKVTARIEFLTILLRIMDFANKNYFEFDQVVDDDINLAVEENFLINQLVSFWNEFETNIDVLQEYFSKDEISSISQIIYSYASAFKE